MEEGAGDEVGAGGRERGGGKRKGAAKGVERITLSEGKGEGRKEGCLER